MDKFKYNILGKVVESETALSDEDIDDIAHSIRLKEQVAPNNASFVGDGFNEGLKEAALGVRQFAASLSAGLGLEDNKAALELTDKINKNRAKYNMTGAAESLYGKSGKVIGETLPFMATPFGARSILGSVAEATGKSALMEATRPTTSPDFLNEERTTNAAVGGITGGTVDLATSAIGVGFDLFKGALRTPKGEIKLRVGKEDINKEVSDIAEDYGIKITPFEATQRPELAQLERELVPETADVRELTNTFLGDARKLSEKNQEFIEAIFENSPEQAAIITRGFSALKHVKDKGRIQQGIEADTFLNHHFKVFQKDKEVQSRMVKEEIGKDSLAYFNEFRQYIRDKAGSSAYMTRQGVLETATKGGRKLTQASKELRDVLTELVPEFAQANKLVRFKKTRETLEATLDSAPSRVMNLNGVEQDVINPQVLYNKHFANNKQFKDMQRMLGGNEEALKKLTQVRGILRALNESPLRRSMFKSKEVAIAPEGGGAFGAAAAAALSINSVLSRKKQANLLKYITNENWQSNILETIDPTLLKRAGHATLQQLDKALTLMSANVATQEKTPVQPQQPTQ